MRKEEGKESKIRWKLVDGEGKDNKEAEENVKNVKSKHWKVRA
jgi:hypothetical protein